jgi:hypothetical protein
MDGNVQNYKFHFVVYGYYDGDTIRFGIDNEVPLSEYGRYIYNDKTNEWCQTTPELERFDTNISFELMHRLSLVGKDEI